MDYVFWFLPNAYPVELMHLFFALFGLIANLATVAYAVGDLMHVKKYYSRWPEDEAHYRNFVAHRNLREETVRFLLNIVFVSIGFVSVTNPPPSQEIVHNDLTFQLRYTRIALTGGSLLLTFKSVKDLTDRRFLQAMMRKESPFKPT